MRENLLTSALHERFLNFPPYARLLSRAARHDVLELNIAGLNDSAKSLIFAMLLNEVKRPFLLVTEDQHRAIRFWEEFSNLACFPVYLYPASEVSPYEQVFTGA